MSSNRSTHRPQKKWGQNFLRNPSAIRRIVEAVEARPGELIVEIGPGEGALTSELVKLPNPIVAIEIDPSLAERLRTAYATSTFSLIEGDATTVQLPDEPFVAVGNLPYNVGNRIIRRIVADPHFRRAVFMVQKEVADRLTAKPRDDAYGFFTIAVELYAARRVLMTLEPGSFFPPPKVRSAVVVFERAPAETANTPETILALASAAFRMRRKKVGNNMIAAGLNRDLVREALARSGIAENARAEELSLADFDRLATNAGSDAVASIRPPRLEELP